MFLVPRRQIWTSQPSQVTGVVDSALTRDLAFVWTASVPDRELLTGILGAPIGAGLGNAVGKLGKSARALPNNGLQFDFPRFSNGSPNWTVVSLCINDAGYSNNRNPFDGDAPAEARVFQLRLDGDNRVNFIGFDTTVGGLSSVTTSATIAAGATAMLVGRVVGNTVSVWSDGVLGASGTISGTPKLPNSANAKLKVGTYGSIASGVAANFPGQLLYNCYWNRALSAVEIKSLSDNPWQIFAPRETRLFVPVSAGVGGTTTVTSDSAASYRVQGSVQASTSASYNIQSAIQSDSTASYAIRSSVQQSIAPSYTVRASIQQGTAPSYSIRGLVAQAIASSYAIRSSISSDVAATYNILSATSVSSSTSAGYNIRGSINQDSAASYALRGSITQDTSATYSILSASSVSSSVTAGYAIKGSVQSSIIAGYSIAQAVQAEIASSYIIRSGVVSEAQAAYIIRGLVQQSIAASYAVFSEYVVPSTFADRTDLKSMMTQHAELKSMMTQHLLLQASIG